MLCEPMLRAWLCELQAEFELLLKDDKAAVGSKKEYEPLAQSDPQVDDLAEDTRNAMDTLRLCVKYLVFDVQVTHRENRHLRKMLGQHKEQDGET